MIQLAGLSSVEIHVLLIKKGLSMFKCKTCEVLKDENKHLRGLVEQLLMQLAPKPDPSDLGASPYPKEEEEFDDEGRPIVRDRVGI